MNAKEYLKRIGLDGEEPSLSYDFLCKLQYAHVTHVPYENLDIVDGIPLSLEHSDIYEKVVTQNRGGYCFELNCIFSALLSKLGFKTRDFLGRFLRGETSIPVRRHRIIAVDLGENTYICDVGMGQSAPRYPLLLKEGIPQEQFGETYRFERDELHGWILYDLHRGEWRKFYSFTEERQLDIDFILPSFYCEKHDASPFNKGVMVAIKTKNGRKAINGKDFKIFEDGDLTYIEENMTDARRLEILKNEFGIEWRK